MWNAIGILVEGQESWRMKSSPDFIRVQFSTGSVYLYTYESAGSENIEEMKELASKGEELNSFINVAVRHYYARRER